MSKVYSFRLDENNPREVQAREVIEAWLTQGYSLRHQLVDVLIAFQNKEFQNNQYAELFEKIERLFLVSKENEDKEVLEILEGTLTETFIGSISKSVKGGIRME